MSLLRVNDIAHMGDDLSVVNAARISYGRTREQLTEADQKLIGYLARNRHTTPFEHTSLTMLIECPLFVRSQIHRHRTMSYNEISRRYTSESIEFFEVDAWRFQDVKNKQSSQSPVDPETNASLNLAKHAVEAQAMAVYDRMVRLGIAREQARMVLPQSLMTKFYMTGNLHNWMKFILARIDPHAQQECREVAQQCLAICQEHFPISVSALTLNYQS